MTPMTTQSGRNITLTSLRGRTVMLVPFLSLCQDVCPLTTGNLQVVQRSVATARQGRRVTIVELSVDPARDSAARLAAYARLNGIHWTLARADPAELAVLMRFFGITAERQAEPSPPGQDWLTGRPLAYDVAHSDGFFILDAKGVERFVSGAEPHATGRLNPTLRRFLSADGIKNLRSPPANGWTPSDALRSLSWVTGSSIPLRGA